MTGVNGKILVNIHGNYVAEDQVSPASWCPPPELPPGTSFNVVSGVWQTTSGTGAYETLQGLGAWATWVVRDGITGRPRFAKECMQGTARFRGE